MKVYFAVMVLFFGVIENAKGEYRAYQFYVKSNLNTSEKAYIVTSALAPLHYQNLHGGKDLISVSLLRTWICPGHTGHLKETCDSPYKKLLVEENGLGGI